jgi:ubiquinone/menaquinone biosynthesis C-methylase UbiE
MHMAERIRNEEYAHGYDTSLAHTLHAVRTAARQASWFLPHLAPGMTLLDCGCATGSITVGLAEAVAPGQATGIDIAEVEIERARARVAEAGVENLRFAVGNVYALEFPDNHFDAAFAHNVLEHVAEPERALREMHRVLKPGGVIGVRDIDVGGHLRYPMDALVERAMTVFVADWEGINGHPLLGRQLGALLMEMGCADVVASASYETDFGANQSGFSAVIVDRFGDPEFVERIIGRGLTNAQEIEAIKAAWQAWSARPDSYHAHAYGQAVGYKR